MARWLKHGLDDSERREIDSKVRKTVETAIADVEARGDAAIREMSADFDWQASVEHRPSLRRPIRL